MKKWSIIIVVLMSVLMACNDDYLQRIPEDALSDQNFWKSAEDIKMYANQFYSYLNGREIYKEDNNSDNQGPSTPDAYLFGHTSVPATGGGWGKNDWANIRSCNFALVRIEDLQKTKDVLRYESEIRFFKAFFYFQKLQLFGDVPWLERDLNTNSEELFAKRDPRKTVVENIIKELDFAIDNLPEGVSDYRINKWAACALKAEVCLYEGTFRKYHDLGDYEQFLREAVSAAELVMDSGLFSIYNTGNSDSDYFDLFVQQDLTGNVEGIMIQPFIKDILMHNEVRWLDEQQSGFTKDFVESFLCTDGLPINLSPEYLGDANWGDEFQNRDPRLSQLVYNSDRPYRIDAQGVVEYRTDLPEFLPGRWYTGYMIIKRFSPLESDRAKEQCTLDKFIYRYAKVLLDYAEAKAELGECTQDVLDKTINRLRDRVDMPHLTVDVGFVDPGWPDWEVPVSPLINEIRRERRIELAADGFRWNDLCRWKAGKLLENPKTYRGARNPDTGDYFVLYPGLERKWDDKLYLHPIPIEELTLNTNLTQNPGW